jgi:hypothetical protein
MYTLTSYEVDPIDYPGKVIQDWIEMYISKSFIVSKWSEVKIGAIHTDNGLYKVVTAENIARILSGEHVNIQTDAFMSFLHGDMSQLHISSLCLHGFMPYALSLPAVEHLEIEVYPGAEVIDEKDEFHMNVIGAWSSVLFPPTALSVKIASTLYDLISHELFAISLCLCAYFPNEQISIPPDSRVEFLEIEAKNKSTEVYLFYTDAEARKSVRALALNSVTNMYMTYDIVNNLEGLDLTKAYGDAKNTPDGVAQLVSSNVCEKLRVLALSFHDLSHLPLLFPGVKTLILSGNGEVFENDVKIFDSFIYLETIVCWYNRRFTTAFHQKLHECNVRLVHVHGETPEIRMKKTSLAFVEAVMRPEEFDRRVDFPLMIEENSDMSDDDCL